MPIKQPPNMNQIIASDNQANNETKAYNQLVDRRLATESSEVFGNFALENSKHIISAFIRSAKQSVTILAGSMREEFYSASESEAAECGKTGCESATSKSAFASLFHAAQTLAATKKTQDEFPIRIIMLEDRDREKIDAFVKDTNRELGNDVIKIYHARYRLQRTNHYLVVDHRRYRLEELHESFAENVPPVWKAEVCCNGPRKAKKIEASFNAIWNKLRDDEKNG